MGEIIQIAKEEARALIASKEVIGSYEPFGLFYYITKDDSGNTLFVGIDNSDGHCWTEEFYSVGSCMAWLRGESYD